MTGHPMARGMGHPTELDSVSWLEMVLVEVWGSELVVSWVAGSDGVPLAAGWALVSVVGWVLV